MCEPYKPQYWFLENCYIFSVFNSQAIKKNVAIQTGDINILKKVLKAGVIKPSYDTILAAAQLGNLQIVQKLLEYKDVFPLSSELFGAACESGNVELITYLEKIGCFAIVLEKVPSSLAEKVAKEINIPIIGIGAGNKVDGQVLVLHDLIGMTKEFNPRFLRRYMSLHDDMIDAISNYSKDIKKGDFPNKNEQY